VTAFDAATAIAPAGPGRWTATVDPGWFAPAGPNGGYLASIVLRAMLAAAGDPARAPAPQSQGAQRRRRHHGDA